jgi:hypothetical protein
MAKSNAATPSTEPVAERKKKTARSIDERIESAKVMLRNLTGDIYAEYGPDKAIQVQKAYEAFKQVSLK